MNVLAATDFFTTEVWSRFGLVTYYVPFFIHLGTRTVHIGGITPNPDQLGERARRHVLNEYVAHYHFERNYQGLGNNLVLADVDTQGYRQSPVGCRERTGGLLKFHYRQAA